MKIVFDETTRVVKIFGMRDSISDLIELIRSKISNTKTFFRLQFKEKIAFSFLTEVVFGTKDWKNVVSVVHFAKCIFLMTFLRLVSLGQPLVSTKRTIQ